jgi:hypothetical protein
MVLSIPLTYLVATFVILGPLDIHVSTDGFTRGVANVVGSRFSNGLLQMVGSTIFQVEIKIVGTLAVKDTGRETLGLIGLS